MTEATWALTMMGVATALGWILALMRGMWVFPLVVAWALRGIGARYADVAPIAAAAGALVPAGIVVGALLSAAARRFAPPATPERNRRRELRRSSTFGYLGSPRRPRSSVGGRWRPS